MTRTDRAISSAGGGTPDWDTSKAVSIDSPYTATENGWVVINGGGIPTLSVNGIQVSRGGNNNNNIDHTDIIPVAKNDIITYSVGNDWSGVKSVMFYPYK